jgi:hypothetical protein
VADYRLVYIIIGLVSSNDTQVAPKNHPTALTTFRESLPLGQANPGNRRCFRRYVLIANSGYRTRYPFVAADTG